MSLSLFLTTPPPPPLPLTALQSALKLERISKETYHVARKAAVQRTQAEVVQIYFNVSEQWSGNPKLLFALWLLAFKEQQKRNNI